MPVYNGGDYFRLALASACAQLYDRFEIVVVDDGSTDDGHAERIAAAAGPRVRYHRQQNQGVGGALNTGLGLMRGDIFCWLSHDDLFLPAKTARQADFHRRLGHRDAVLISDYALIDPDGALLDPVRADHAALVACPLSTLLRGAVNGCTIFAPAHVMAETGTFDPALRYTQDYHFWNRMIRRFDFFHQPEILVHYRVHPGQGSNHPKAVDEGDALWVRMMSDRSEAERTQMAGSTLRFFAWMADHLATSPYRQAQAFAEARRDAARSSKRFSLALAIPQGTGSAAAALLADIVARFGADAQVSAACQSETDAAVVRKLGLTPVICPGDSGEVALLNAAMATTTQPYVVLARAGQATLADWPGRVRRLQEQGLRAMAAGQGSGTVTMRDALTGRSATRLHLEDLVFHRLLLDEGRTIDPAACALDETVAILSFVADDLALDAVPA
jgi:hypothetical protein